MQGITAASFRHYFTNPPSDSSLTNVTTQIKWETAKVYGLRAAEITSLVGLVALAAVGSYFLYATSYALVAIPVVLITAFIAKMTFSFFESYLADRTQKRMCYQIFEKLHPEIPAKKKDEKPTRNMTPLSSDSYYQPDTKLFTLMAELKHPSSVKVLPTAIAEKRAETARLLESEAQELVKNHYFEIEEELQSLLAQLSPIQKEFAHIRLSQLLYTQAIQHLDDVAKKAAKTFAWIPTAEILADIENQINKESSKILLLKIAEWALIIGTAALAAVGAYFASPNIFLVMIIGAATKFAIEGISKLFEPIIAKRKEVLKSYILYDTNKSSKDTFAIPSADKLKTFIEGMLEETETHSEEAATKKPAVSAFYKKLGRYYNSSEKLGITPLADKIAYIKTKNAQFEVALPEDKINEFISSNTYFAKTLKASQKHFWALTLSSTVITQEYEDLEATEVLFEFSEAALKTQTQFVNECLVFDLFSKAANAMTKALETKKGPIATDLIKKTRDTFIDSLETCCGSNNSLEPVETKFDADQRVVCKDEDGASIGDVSHGEQIQLLEKLEQSLPNAFDSTNHAKVESAILKLRSLLKKCSDMNPVWCQNGDDANKPLKRLPIILTPEFFSRAAEIYKKLIDRTLEIQIRQDQQEADARLIKNTLNRIATLIREHSKLSAEVVKARDAKTKLDGIYKATVDQVASFVTKKMTRNNQLARLIAADELDGEQSISCTPQYTPNPRSFELEWNVKANQFKGSPANLNRVEASSDDNESVCSTSESESSTLPRAISNIRNIVGMGYYAQSFEYIPVKNEPTLIFSRTTSDGTPRQRVVPIVKLLAPKDANKLERIYYKMAGNSPLKPKKPTGEGDDTEATPSNSSYLDWLHVKKPTHKETSREMPGFTCDVTDNKVSEEEKIIESTPQLSAENNMRSQYNDDDD